MKWFLKGYVGTEIWSFQIEFKSLLYVGLQIMAMWQERWDQNLCGFLPL